MKQALLGFAALAAAVLGWGAWQAYSHADVWLQVKDHAGRTPRQLWADAKDAQLVLRDAAGLTLVEAELRPPDGLPRYTGPPGAVDCRAQEGQGGAAWRDCFERQSRWLSGWAPNVDTAQVTVGTCVIDSTPIARKLYTSWWFWWVPLPHVGGTPTNHYTLNVHIDSAKCVAVSPAP